MSKREREEPWAEIPMSVAAANTKNPIRIIVDRMAGAPNPSLYPIRVSIGDPTLDGNFLPPAVGDDAVIAAIKSHKANGYGPAHGVPDARKAVAEKLSLDPSSGGMVFTENDVVLTCGASGALDIAMNVLANPGDNILIPTPGFSLYDVVCEHAGLIAKHYTCNPDRGWEADIAQMTSLIDSRTKAILINNPSNPCGSVFSREHLVDIAAVAERYKVPIISDEIYGGMTFGVPFVSMAAVCGSVPCILIGGLAKQYVVPGWRMGWAVVCDRGAYAAKLREGMVKLTTLILGPSSVLQDAIRPLLFNTPKDYYEGMLLQLQKHAGLSYDALRVVPGLSPIRPLGAMYMMVRLDTSVFNGITDDVDFCAKLWLEQSVQCLPGQCFRATNFIRLVFTNSEKDLVEAYRRIAAFCKSHERT